MTRIYSLSIPDTQKNINTVRRLAREKGLKLVKVRNQDLWDLKLEEDNTTIKSHLTIGEAYDFLIEYDY